MKKTIVRTMSLIIALALTLGTFTSGQAKSNMSTAVLTFVAEADSRVPEAKPDLNFGRDTVLYMDGGATDPDIESYIQFTVTGISGGASEIVGNYPFRVVK